MNSTNINKKIACPEDFNKLLDALKQVSAKQESYKEKYLAMVDIKASTAGTSSPEQTIAAKFSIVKPYYSPVKNSRLMK